MIIKFEDRKGAEPFYIQIYKFIAEEIKNGTLKKGDKLPSKKNMCNDLNVSQTTVENAYEMLDTEGYISSVPRKGYFVQEYESMPDIGTKIRTGTEKTDNNERYIYDLSSDSVDTSVFPFATWARINKNVMYNEPSLLNRGEGRGDRRLREELAKYLHAYRGVNAGAQDIIAGAGTEYLLSLLCRLVSEKTVFAVEDPGYESVKRNLEDNRMKVVSVGVKEDGINIELLENTGADIAYVTPSHQFPTGVTMPAGRRMKLLKWAAEGNKYILEDDYDSEFRFSGRPIPSLQGADKNDRVIYIGTFSRNMAPSVRISYMVLPPDLMKIYNERLSYNASTISRFEQQTMAEFLSGGYYVRHMNRMRTFYRRKRDTVIRGLEEIFDDGEYILSGGNLGLHFLLQFPHAADIEGFKEKAENAGIRMTLLKETAPVTLVFGFAGICDKDIKPALMELKKALD